MHRVLFVCLGNICRSPMAEGIFRRHVEAAGLSHAFHIDSAGTGRWHAGEPPDPRAQSCLLGRGVDISGLRARQFTAKDFDQFDHILVMDSTNLNDVLYHARTDADRARVRKFLSFGKGDPDSDVPDPYFGGGDGFERVFDMLDEAARGLLSHVIAP